MLSNSKPSHASTAKMKKEDKFYVWWKTFWSSESRVAKPVADFVILFPHVKTFWESKMLHVRKQDIFYFFSDGTLTWKH